jgi:hypothetical protein
VNARWSTLPVLLILGSCGMDRPGSCVPAWNGFRYSRDRQFWREGAIPIVPPGVNVVKVHRSGAVTWNDADLGTSEGF